ncbi:MAG: ATP synthase F1 subunit gamma [Proteobacteria bacterium]|nr:ATP synthase F1 subunit gamma [Cystobacterineae bacterium]MCL2258979.1 ATP synthase F1 subunit gamma [Cystobacterineae bacterium]MCL2314665.1 ATP synthase F1 subunit gamma [Pseudomonadota bacterium]
MASLRDIRKRIRSVKNTRQITKAMKMVAAAKLRRAQDAAVAARPYARTLDNMVAGILGRSGVQDFQHPLLESRPEKKRIAVFVVTSDRGLAGGFNHSISRRVLRFLKEHSEQQEVLLFTMGRKGNEFFRNRGTPICKDYPGLMSQVSHAAVAEICEEVSRQFLAKEVDAVFVCFNEFISAISQKVRMTQLLPFEMPTVDANDSGTMEPLYEPSCQEVLNHLVPRALAVRLYHALLESIASEHGARMTAMESATNNAGEMLDKLSLFYNRTRQAAITRELVEIVSGAQALSG